MAIEGGQRRDIHLGYIETQEPLVRALQFWYVRRLLVNGIPKAYLLETIKPSGRGGQS